MKESLDTIKVWTTTKKKLDEIKVHSQQSYDNLINMLISEHISIDNIDNTNGGGIDDKETKKVAKK